MLPDGAGEIVRFLLNTAMCITSTYEAGVFETGNNLWRKGGSDRLVGGGGRILVRERRISRVCHGACEVNDQLE